MSDGLGFRGDLAVLDALRTHPCSGPRALSLEFVGGVLQRHVQILRLAAAILPPMEEDTFNWRSTLQWSDRPPDTLCLGTKEVARLHQKVDNKTWFATLDQHLDYEKRRRRDCTSYESGKAGAMTWALRHEARIRREIEELRARRGR